MKKWCFFLGIYACLCLLAACASGGSGSPVPGGTPSEEPQGGETAQSANEWGFPDTAVQPCRIVDGAETGHLLLAGMPGGSHDDSIFRLVLENEIPVYLDGVLADPSALEDGMPIEVVYHNFVATSSPASFGEVQEIHAWSRGTERNPDGGYYDLCGFYLKVLDDLWQVDPALNEGKPLAALDLSQAPGGLSESEKRAIALLFGEAHGVEVITATMEELVEQGYISQGYIDADPPADNPTFYHWDDGCLFSITPHETEEEEFYSLPVLRFDAEKYASSLGAYIFYDCSAVWPETGTWSSYQIGAEMIS